MNSTQGFYGDQNFIGGQGQHDNKLFPDNRNFQKEFYSGNPEANRSMNDMSSNISVQSDDDGDSTDDKRQKFDDEPDSKSKEQIDRRRERNRLLARKTRQRKKVFYESLQRQVAQLVKENEILKGLVHSQQSEQKNSSNSNKFSTTRPTEMTKQEASSILEKADARLVNVIQASHRSFLITNPALPDNPIVFASRGFFELTGYNPSQVLGRNCRFLQGPGTDRRQVDVIKKGIASGVDTAVCLLNYRADGSSFYNQLFIAALRDSNKKIINYIGVQVPIEIQKICEVPDVKQSRRAIKPENKPENKDVKDEEKDTREFIEPWLLEEVTGAKKTTFVRAEEEEMSFDFDGFMQSNSRNFV